MRRTIKYYRLIWLRYDLPAGISVFLVALPLCLGIALASGAPLYSGIISGIIGGLVVGFISGSQLAVSGPAAGLSTVVAASIVSLGDFNRCGCRRKNKIISHHPCAVLTAGRGLYSFPVESYSLCFIGGHLNDHRL